jgi:hypothetical protein
VCCSAKILRKVARYGRAEDFPCIASRVVYIHEDIERTNEIIASAIACQRTCYAERGTDRGKPKPELVRPEDLPWERYLVGTQVEVAEGLVRLYEEVPYDHLSISGAVCPALLTSRRSPLCASSPKWPRGCARRWKWREGEDRRSHS